MIPYDEHDECFFGDCGDFRCYCGDFRCYCGNKSNKDEIEILAEIIYREIDQNTKKQNKQNRKYGV